MLAIAHGAAILAASMDTSKWKEDDDQSVDVDEEILDGPIVYTAKHNYLIQLTKNGRKEMERFIDDQTPLPFNVNRQLGASGLVSNADTKIPFGVTVGSAMMS